MDERKLILSVGSSRRAIDWQPQTMTVPELYARLRVPARGTETMAEYLQMPKGRQDDLKDIGGFVAGSLQGSRRKAGAVLGRDVITLDLDTIPAYRTDDITERVKALGYSFCIYSTRKHTPNAPRLRVLLPLDRTCSADEYEPIARRVAERIGMEFADPTTFEASRLMYWPSCCADSEYVFAADEESPLCSVDALLATYDNWKDQLSWPTVPGAVNPARMAAKQGDPETKSGVVGAFCRVYNIESAMDTFIPGIYEPVDSMPGRYSFTGGSTTGGAVLYDNGKFLYSHHATDPCGSRLVNAFDMVRLHKFADIDDNAQPGTPTNRLPSYTAMCEFISTDQKVVAEVLKNRQADAESAFDKVDSEDADAWRGKLELNQNTLRPKPTIDNILLILENDPKLKDRFALNEFAGRGEVLQSLPWCDDTKRRLWNDNDSFGLYWYLEKNYSITGNGKIDAALSIHSERHAFNEVTTYLKRLEWDGVSRLDSLFIDYLGADDTAYTRGVTRKAFTAAVARAMSPGTKYDCMLILSGSQGLGKSTLLDKMSLGWFNDSIRTFEGKEASELLQGVWLVEVSELDAFRRTDVSRIKQFLSQRADRFRAAYGRHVKEIPRRCVFFGTTNTSDFLQDRTGNRRFWPIPVGLNTPKKSVWADLDTEKEQIWAEAVMRWRLGESLFLTGELEQAAKVYQEAAREVDPKEGMIIDFLSRPIPKDWGDWSMDRRRTFWNGSVVGEVELVQRDRVCALEIWCELFDRSKSDLNRWQASEINSIIESLPGWTKRALRFGCHGTQRGFAFTGALDALCEKALERNIAGSDTP